MNGKFYILNWYKGYPRESSLQWFSKQIDALLLLVSLPNPISVIEKENNFMCAKLSNTILYIKKVDRVTYRDLTL